MAEVRHRLAQRGVYDKCGRVNAAVAPDAVVFWRAYRDRVAARELFTPITDIVEARDIAVGILEELGVDMTSVNLRATWRPPRMVFQADPSYEVAMATVAEVRETIRRKGRGRVADRITVGR